MTPEEYIEAVTEAIENALERIGRALPRLQSKMYERVIELAYELGRDKNNIKSNIENLRTLSRMRLELDRILSDPQFRAEIEIFKQAFDKVERLNASYFSNIAEVRGVEATMNELKRQVIEEVQVKLSNQRLSILLTDKVHEILRVSITSGATYTSMLKSVQNFLQTNATGNEFARYAKQIATDALNQYNATYTKLASDDLGLVFYQYSGSLLTTSREFCKELVDQRYVHKSQIPELLKGHVNGKHIPLSEKTGLPYGLVEGTNKDNFQVRRGGYNCSHQLIPVSSAVVPEPFKQQFQ